MKCAEIFNDPRLSHCSDRNVRIMFLIVNAWVYGAGSVFVKTNSLLREITVWKRPEIHRLSALPQFIWWALYIPLLNWRGSPPFPSSTGGVPSSTGGVPSIPLLNWRGLPLLNWRGPLHSPPQLEGSPPFPSLIGGVPLHSPPYLHNWRGSPPPSIPLPYTWAVPTVYISCTLPWMLRNFSKNSITLFYIPGEVKMWTPTCQRG